MAFPIDLKFKFIELLRQKKIFNTHGWTNFMGTVVNPAALVIEVANQEQLQTVLREINVLNQTLPVAKKITVRASGGWSDENVSQCCFFSPWSQQQRENYNEGYSFSPVVGGSDTVSIPGTDVVIRFAKKFHNMKVLGPVAKAWSGFVTPIHSLPSYLVEVSAGVQIAELATFLRAKNLSLTTVSMISWVTAVGLAGTGGHGTGRSEPSFSGLIESMTVCDMHGNIREINSQHPDFKTLCGAHSGLLGVVLSIKIRVVEAFNLRETIDVFASAQEMKYQLADVLADNQYVSIMWVPGYIKENVFATPRLQIRKWNYTSLKPEKIVPAPYDPDVRSLNQELEVKLGASAMDFLLDSGLKHLLPAFMAMSAAMVIGTRGIEPVIGYENHITHPQVAFPKKMRDVSFIIPVKDDEAGSMLEKILQKMEDLFYAGAKKGEFPVTYAVYVRYIAGTSGGLSTTGTISDHDRVLVIDVVTHPEAPGIQNFEQQLMNFLRKQGLTPRHHLGKNFPAGISCYEQFLDTEQVSEYCAALVRWHATPQQFDGAEQLAKSPFLTPYLNKMLTPQPKADNRLDPVEADESFDKPVPHKDHTEQECLDFLTKLHAEITQRQVVNEGKAAKDHFLRVCAQELEARTARINAKALA